ncbi:hypothetical protein ACFXHD_25390 [Streptomyces hydrogenans]|uniref:hypothetical protein n=1 Tax=Streptomyces hydrogenans TaxID=1873719 RepID=UPI0036980F3D
MTTNLTPADIVWLVLIANLMTIGVLLGAVSLAAAVYKVSSRLVVRHEEWKERRARRKDLDTCMAISRLGVTSRGRAGEQR